MKLVFGKFATGVCKCGSIGGPLLKYPCVLWRFISPHCGAELLFQTLNLSDLRKIPKARTARSVDSSVCSWCV